MKIEGIVLNPERKPDSYTGTKLIIDGVQHIIGKAGYFIKLGSGCYPDMQSGLPAVNISGQLSVLSL